MTSELMIDLSLKEKIQSLSQSFLADVIESRRHIHAHPELAFEEVETAAYVSSQLEALGIPHVNGIAKTGIVGLIKGKHPDKKVIALRADMDALPIREENDVAYRSKNIGVMHACGHDVHTASLLGAARILQAIREEFEGTVKLIFQPSEEKIPGGASVMIEEKVLEDPAPVAIYGQHVLPHIDAGKVGFRSGKYMASADEIYVTITGKGGHAAMPQENIDPVLIASHMIIALQQMVSRQAHPVTPTVLSFGKFIANGATNVIPDKVELEGTFRTLDEDWRAKAHQNMKKMAEQIAAGMGGQCEFTIKKGYPFLVNDRELTGRTITDAREYLGEENVLDLDIWMAAEDFAFYTQQMPGCFYRLGVRNEAAGITSPVHTSTFNIDESALETGMGLMAWLAVQELSR